MRFGPKQAAAVARAGQKKRQATIQALIDNVRAKTGRAPTDAEIAGYLATSVKRVRFHLSQTNKGTRQ